MGLKEIKWLDKDYPLVRGEFELRGESKFRTSVFNSYARLPLIMTKKKKKGKRLKLVTELFSLSFVFFAED